MLEADGGIIFHNPLTVITPDSHMTIFIILFTNMRREINIYIHCVIILSMSTYRTIINKSNQSFIPPHNCWASYMMIYGIKYIDKVFTQPHLQLWLVLQYNWKHGTFEARSCNNTVDWDGSKFLSNLYDVNNLNCLPS